MKRKLFQILFLMVSNFVFAQNSVYTRFISENKTWLEEYNRFNNDDLSSDGETFRWVAFFKGDTLIDSLMYSKMYKQKYYYEHYPDIDDGSHYWNTTWGEVELYELVREDTTEKKVWVKDQDGQERLVYDFNTSVNDTIEGETGMQFIVDSISEYVLNNAEARKTIYISSINNNIDNGYYIEGIGGENGIFSLSHQTINDGGYSGEILCYLEDSIPQLKTCDLNTLSLTQNINSMDHLTIIPNPFYNQFILSNAPANVIPVLIDITGVKYEIDYKRGRNEVIVDGSKLKPSIYLLVLQNENGNIVFKKRIIKN